MSQAPEPDPRQLMRRDKRIGFCIGLALLAFGVAGGFGPDNALINGLIAAVGAVIVGFVLPVGE
jgi:hypothetical protein